MTYVVHNLATVASQVDVVLGTALVDYPAPRERRPQWRTVSTTRRVGVDHSFLLTSGRLVI